MLMHSAFAITSLVTYILMAVALALVVILLIARLLKNSWGRVLVGVVIAVGFGYLGMKWMDADSDAVSACRHLEAAMAMTRMYEYQAGVISRSPAGESQMLDSCRQVLGAYNRDRFMTETGERTWITCRQTHFSDEVARAAGLAAVEMLERSPDPKDRSAARFYMMEGSAGSRIYTLLHRSTGPQSKLITDLGKEPARDQQVNACVLAGWYYQKKQYGKSLAKLKLALGDGWLRTGKFDDWWKQNLLPGPEQRTWYGYVLYKTGHADRALKEFRRVYGASQTKTDMQGVYMHQPPLKM